VANKKRFMTEFPEIITESKVSQTEHSFLGNVANKKRFMTEFPEIITESKVSQTAQFCVCVFCKFLLCRVHKTKKGGRSCHFEPNIKDNTLFSPLFFFV
jgi:hypothetical protein